MAVIIPWSNALTNLLLFGGVLFIIESIITTKGRTLNVSWINKCLFGFGISFLLLVLMNIILKSDNSGFDYLARISTIVLLPTMIFILANRIPAKQNIKVLKFYAHSVALLSLGTFLVAVGRTLTSAAESSTFLNLAYFKLSSSLVHHEPIYFSIMVGASIFFIFWALLFGAFEQNRILLIVEVLFLLLFLFLLGSRTAILATLACMGIIGAAKSKKHLIYISFTFALLFLLNYKFNPSFRSRADYVINFSTDFDYQNDWSYEGLALRYMTWNCAVEGIKENFLFGTGITESQNYLNDCYRENRYESLLYFSRKNGSVFNSHNVYLDIFLKFGLSGIVILIGILVLMLLSAVKNNNIMLFVLVVFFMINGLTESLLVREKGIVFFSFFFGLFLCFNPKRKLFKK
ncbi:MAG: O-antigen ligase family protein [Maribacter sp.]